MSKKTKKLVHVNIIIEFPTAFKSTVMLFQFKCANIYPTKKLGVFTVFVLMKIPCEKEFNTKELNTQELNTQELNTQELNTQELNTQELNTQELNT